MAEEKRIKLAVVAGASEALKYKEKNPRATEQEIIQNLTNRMSEIVRKLDNEEI